MVLDCIICYMLYVKSDYGVFHSSLYEAFCLNARHGRATCFVRDYSLRSLHHSPGSLYLLYIPSSLPRFPLPSLRPFIILQFPLPSLHPFITLHATSIAVDQRSSVSSLCNPCCYVIIERQICFCKKLESFFSPWAGNVSHSIMPRRFFRKIIHYLPLFYQSPLFTPTKRAIDKLRSSAIHL